MSRTERDNDEKGSLSSVTGPRSPHAPTRARVRWLETRASRLAQSKRRRETLVFRAHLVSARKRVT